MNDNIGGVLEQSLHSISMHLSSEKDLPKHNAMFLFSVLDWQNTGISTKTTVWLLKDFRALKCSIRVTKSMRRLFTVPLTSISSIIG